LDPAPGLGERSMVPSRDVFLPPSFLSSLAVHLRSGGVGDVSAVPFLWGPTNVD